jgi:hypothetical protein
VYLVDAPDAPMVMRVLHQAAGVTSASDRRGMPGAAFGLGFDVPGAVGRL